VTSVEYADQSRRCAVIYNPTKVSDNFRALVEEGLQRKGWGNTLWLETSVEDPGRDMTKQAIAEQVDLVIGAGGDGTIRYVADSLAHTGIPLGLVPAGTSNLLARNLDLPLEEVDAIEVALAGQIRLVDLVNITVDDHPPEHFAVMAGIGVDAMIIDETNVDLKDKVGSAAYFVAAAKALGRRPVRMTVQLDTNRPFRRHAMLCVIGNVDTLRGNLTLIPGASPNDGLLDLYIASPRRFRHWVKLALRLITRRAKKDDQVDQRTGKRYGSSSTERKLPARRRRRRRVHHPDRRDPTRCPGDLRPTSPGRQRAATVTRRVDECPRTTSYVACVRPDG
jgi:diacylglycerol kinase family enzyme